MEAEARPRRSIERGMIGPRRFEQAIGADEVGGDERLRRVDRTIDMRLGGKMHHRVGPMLREDTSKRHTVGDVGHFEHIAAGRGERVVLADWRRHRSACRD